MSEQASTPWPQRTLGELCATARGIAYGIVKVGDYVAGGVPVIRGGNIRRNRIDFNGDKRVSNEVSNQFQRTILRGGEIVLNLIAEPGHSAVVPLSMKGYNVSRDVAVIPLGTEVNHRFVNYVLQSPQTISWLTSRLQGSVTQKINLGTLRDVPVPIPPAWEQDSISSILSALDAKVELNQKLAVSADALWRSCVAAAVQPIEEGGNVDERAKIIPLSTLADFINGRAFTKGATGTGPMVVRIAELNSGPSASTVYNDIDVSAEYMARPGSLLFAWSGSLTVQRWFRPEAIINQHIFNVVPKPGVPIWLVHWHLLNLLPGYQRIAAGKATTMGHIQRRDLDITVVIPDEGTLSKLDSICTPLWKRALQAEVETLSLVAIRDMLLPKLLSGELRVRAGKKLVEAAK
jgi:type I restriction enzyme S subunit